ncbi:MAG: hypothetical protein AAF517_17000 [Planctomycetota bacterium]
MKSGFVRTALQRAAAYTLVELMVIVSITVLLLGAALSALTNLQGAIAEASVTVQSDELARNTMHRLFERLRNADKRTLVLYPTTDAHTITFSEIEGWGGVEPILSATPTTIAFTDGYVYMNGETVFGGLGSVKFNLEDSELITEIQVQNEVEGETLTRKLVAKLRL